MNVLTIFDQRITAIFEQGAPGTRLPFSFKRLAKRAVREMEDETFVIDGVDTAPALYTVLVSHNDDALMRPMYVQICDEISQLIEAQAKKRGYTFVGRPLVRFMVDPALRAGRFSIFAENIDPRTLARLRDEENAYLGITPPISGYPSQGFVPAQVPIHEEEPAPVSQEVSFDAELDPFLAPEPSVPEEGDSYLEAEPELDVPEVDVPEVDVPELDVPEVDALDAEVPEVDVPVIEPPVASMSEQNLESSFDVEDDLIPEPATLDDFFNADPQDFIPAAPEPVHAVRSGSHFSAPIPAAAPEPEVTLEPACTLVDLGSGRTYRITTTMAPIGRERLSDGVVLTDPNASRRHAELLFDGSNWSVRDLNSTNGTLVNDIDVADAVLRDGDVLTIGLTNLEFRAG